MKTIELALMGWAVSLDGEAVRTIIKIAFVNAGLGFAWVVDFTAEYNDIRNPAIISVRAQRCISQEFNPCGSGNSVKNMQCIAFSFPVAQFSKVEIYEGALLALEKFSVK